LGGEHLLANNYILHKKLKAGSPVLQIRQPGFYNRNLKAPTWTSQTKKILNAEDAAHAQGGYGIRYILTNYFFG